MKRTMLATLMMPAVLAGTPIFAGTLVNVTIHQSLADKLINIPVNETRAINQDSGDGIHVEGTAQVTGQVKARFNPETDGAGLMLQMDTKTLTSTNQSTFPKNNLHIWFDWDITTGTSTYKRVVLRPDGIKSGDAIAYSNSSIAYGPIHAEAGGLFPRVTAGIALKMATKKIYGRHNQSVADANQSVGSTLAGSLDEQVAQMLKPVEESFARFVQGPFVKRKMLGGGVSFAGDESVAQIRVEDKPRQGDVVSALDVSENEPVAVELNPKSVETFLAKTFGGAVFTDVELAQMQMDKVPPVNSLEDLIQKPEELLVHFDETLPVSVDFNADEISLALRAQRVETLGKSWSNVEIKRVFKIRHQGSKLMLSFMDPWVIAGREGTVVDPIVAKHMVSRLDEILPQGEIDIAGMSLGQGLPVKAAISNIAVSVDSLLAKFSVTPTTSSK